MIDNPAPLINTMTPHEVRSARAALGHLWQLGRDLSQQELADCLGLANAAKVADMETPREARSDTRITGPVSCAIRGMLAGYVPDGAPPKAFDAMADRMAFFRRMAGELDITPQRAAEAAGRLIDRGLIEAPR